MSSEPTPLEQQLIAQIRRDGPLTFCELMRAALYDSTQGYYNTERLKIGPAGDYYTSSNVHAAFGAVLAHAFAELWNEFHDMPLTLVEMGAGTGQLACDVLTAMRDEQAALFDHLRYVIVDTSPAMVARQRERLTEFTAQVQWRLLTDIEHEPITGIFFSNELVDAMPVHRVRFNRGHLEAQVVTMADERLMLGWIEPSSSALADYLKRAGVKLIEDQIIEINLDAIGWLADVSRALARGLLVTIDYGDICGHLYARDRMHGTLRTFYQHRLMDAPLERLGEQDITASVNFTALMEYGRDVGLETVSYERQTAFLMRYGLIERVAALHGDTIADLKARLAVKHLFVPGGVSDNFRVLVQKQTSGKLKS
jgi:SAM-dependent MidA family methyltransferase